ncbi:MAG: endo-1,4-beta-xylanase [Oscillospiraceae bacterium]|jgi:endo-1,4-beta-xylanase|nr:endo-1,4-beta-xylanase [Oscillospiraceae bacterium]
MKRKQVLLCIFAVVTALSMNIGAGTASAEAERAWDLTLPSLKDTFADYFGVGNILEPVESANAETAAMFKHHYNFVTAENAMKPSNLSRGPGDFRLFQSDQLVDWAVENGINVVGHTLVWHSQSARWLNTNDDGSPLTRAEARENMEEYINTVAGHFAGRIYSWDVVNEAFQTSVSSAPAETIDGWWRTMLRTGSGGNDASMWYAAYANGMDEEAGEHPGDYIYDAFVFARLADPNAILYYNDFNETDQGKREAMAQMTEELNKQWETDPLNTEPGRLLIEGLGMQAHYWTDNLTPASVELTIMRFAETGARVSITELDIPIGRWNGYREANEETLARQAELYQQLFEVFMRHSDSIERVTFWGKADTQSWRRQGNPLLFDGSFRAKPAFHSIMAVAPDPSLPSEPDPEEDDDENITDVAEDGGDDGRDEQDFSWGIIAIAIAGGGVLVLGGTLLMLNKRK